MRAYVIKNKEGKYKEPYLDIREFYTGSLADAAIFTDRELIECYCPSDCKVVEVTIAEGDLQQQLVEKDNEIEALKEETKMLESWKETYYKNWQKAKKELEEMRFRERNLGGLIEKVSSKGQQQIRHQVCEEIREKANEISFWDCESDCRIIEKDEFDETLNKIEQGEVK